jgi:DNA invertase Pin-like site-specific DNA recombinase
MTQKVPFICCDLGTSANPFMLHIYASLAEQERRMISERTKVAMQAAKARGVNIGNATFGDVNQQAAQQRATELAPIMSELAHLSANAAAKALNERHIPTPTGALWSAKTVIRVRDRVAA